MTQITKINPTTELEAVNAMLAALGEAPVASIDADLPNVAIAINTLRDATREIQSMGWRFNTEWGYQIAPVLSFAYADRDSEVTSLNVFMAPPRLLRFKVTEISEQQGSRILDTVLRPSRRLAVTVSGTGDAAEVSLVSDIDVSGAIHPMVFYDRVLNRDGFDSSERDFLYIDPVWAFDFEEMPEEARRCSLVLAMRRWLASQAPSVNLVGFTENDFRIALRNLKVAHGEVDDDNMLDNTDTAAFLGRLTARGSALIDPRRKSPGAA